MADSHSSGDYSDVVSRRKFVSLAGTTGAAAVAGCIFGDGDGDDSDDSGGESDDSTTDDSTTDDSTTDDSSSEDSDGPTEATYPDTNRWFITFSGSFSPDQFQYNPLVGWFIPHDQFGLFAPWVKYLNGLDEWVPHLVTDWTHDGNELVLTVSDQFTWGTSGETITAEDLKLQLQIQKNAQDAAWDFIVDGGVTAASETELRIEYAEGTRPSFVTYSVLPKMAAYAPSNWEGEEDNESPSQVEVTTPDPSGPVALTEATSNYNRTEPRSGLDDYEDHFLAENYNWNGYQLEYRSSNNAAHQSFIAGEVDGIHSLFVKPSTLENFPDSVRQFQIPGNFGMAIWPWHGDGPFSNRNVRQAFYYSLDRGSIIQNVGESTKVSHHPAPTGLTWASVDTYLGAKEPEGFNVYDLDLDKAESLLSEAGYSAGDIDATIAFPSGWSDWAVAAQSAIDQLNNAGWNASSDARSGGPGGYINDLGEDFPLGVDQHTPGGQPRQNLPYFGFNYILRNVLRDKEQHFAGYTKNEVELPDVGTVNIDETMDQLASATDEAEQEELIRQLALVVNKDVPVFYMMEKYEQSFINTRKFAIPESSKHFNAFWPLWWLPKIDEKLEDANEMDTPGLLKAKPE